jgi:hypothetical protein
LEKELLRQVARAETDTLEPRKLVEAFRFVSGLIVCHFLLIIV